MKEFETSLRDAFRGDAAPADEGFVDRVGDRIRAREQGRPLGLVLAASTAIALITVMAVGIGITAPEMLTLVGLDRPPVSDRPFLPLVQAVSVAGILLVASLAYPLVRHRR